MGAASTLNLKILYQTCSLASAELVFQYSELCGIYWDVWPYLFIALGVVLFPFLAKDDTSPFGLQNVLFLFAVVVMTGCDG